MISKSSVICSAILTSVVCVNFITYFDANTLVREESHVIQISSIQISLCIIMPSPLSELKFISEDV